MSNILKALEDDARLTPERLGKLTGLSPQEASAEVEKAERNGVILGYRTIIDWDRTAEDLVQAWVELRVVPQQGTGFDAIAERIARFDEAHSVFLLSGSYDVGLIVQARTMHDVSNFVAEKLATMEGVQSTVTHFIMRRYKVQGVQTVSHDSTERLAVSP
ncbi:MAG TPA: Lrp/AsnC family transcriptional regulator [Dehalococcoidia bacterium]|nr:Lrp/AsnC family transcriptional regulator [Dehalococcoidia bacterium]